MSDDPNAVSCDHIIRLDWLGQAVLVFNNLDEAKSEIGRLGGEVTCCVAGAGYAENKIDGAGLFWMVFPGGEPSVGTMVHEAIHVVDYLCDYAGIPISEEASEVRCYLTTWLVEVLMKRYGMKVTIPC